MTLFIPVRIESTQSCSICWANRTVGWCWGGTPSGSRSWQGPPVSGTSAERGQTTTLLTKVVLDTRFWLINYDKDWQRTAKSNQESVVFSVALLLHLCLVQGFSLINLEVNLLARDICIVDNISFNLKGKFCHRLLSSVLMESQAKFRSP